MNGERGMNESNEPQKSPAPRQRYVRAVGPRLRLLLYFIFGLVAVLAANSVYLSSISFLEWKKNDPNTTYQNWFYMVMFGSHLALGLLLICPVVLFGIIHIKNSHNRPNRRAVRVGYLLFFTSLIVLVTGLLLTRADVFQFKNLGLKDPHLRGVAYWARARPACCCLVICPAPSLPVHGLNGNSVCDGPPPLR